MKKIITLLMALLLCFGLTGCAKLDYIFNGEDVAEPKPLPLIYEHKIVAGTTLEDLGNGYYQATLNGMIKFDYFPKNIALFLNGNIVNVEPESVVYANVIANDNSTATWYVATFNKAVFNFPKIDAGKSNLTVYAEDTKGTMYITKTTLTLTSEKALTGCTLYGKDLTAQYPMFNDFGLDNGEIMFEFTGRNVEGSVDLSGYPIEFVHGNLLKHEVGQLVEIESPELICYQVKGWLNKFTGDVYVPDENGKVSFLSDGGAMQLCAIWELAPGSSIGPEIEL